MKNTTKPLRCGCLHGFHTHPDHFCKKPENHKGKHKCNYCQIEWPQDKPILPDTPCCGNCKWFISNYEYGTCKDALERARKLIPKSVCIPQGLSPNDIGTIKVSRMTISGGHNCPCWERKEI